VKAKCGNDATELVGLTGVDMMKASLLRRTDRCLVLTSMLVLVAAITSRHEHFSLKNM
jgi:hypothetical protein